MIETQETICKWASDTFGTAGNDTLLRVAVRAQEEFVEFMRSYAAGKPDPMELADTAIVACRLAQRCGMTIDFKASILLPKIVGLNLDTATGGDYRRGYVGFAHRWMSDVVNATMSILPVSDHEIGWMTVELIQALVDLAWCCDEHLDDLVQAKMTINRGRKWNLDHTGHGYHVREPAGA